MNKAIILSADGFEDMEFFYPLYRLREEGWKVDVASHSKKGIFGKHGYEYKSDLTFKDVNPEKYGLLLIPGGKAPESVRLDRDALRITRFFFKKKRPVAAICHGAQVLISAGVVEGRKLTCWKGIRDDVIAAGGTYSDCMVAEDHNLITSRQPDDLPAFMMDILSLIEKKPMVHLKEVVGGI